MTDCGGDDEQDGRHHQGEREDGLGRAVGDATLRTAVGAAAVDPKHAAAEDAERNDDAGGREQVRSSSSSPPTFGWRWTVSLLVQSETVVGLFARARLRPSDLPPQRAWCLRRELPQHTPGGAS